MKQVATIGGQHAQARKGRFDLVAAQIFPGREIVTQHAAQITCFGCQWPDLIRITARFVEVGSGAVVRTVKIDGAIGDIFSLQDKIVFELSQGMNLTLEDSEMAEIERQETESVEAYENRSRAMMNIMEGSPQALDHAILLLEKATRQDPKYAAAWAARPRNVNSYFAFPRNSRWARPCRPPVQTVNANMRLHT